MKPHHRFADLLQLITLLVLLLILLVASPVGLQLVAKIVNVSGMGLKIEDVKGTLLQGAEIKKLSWIGKEVSIELKEIKLDFFQTVYANSALHIDDLQASALNIYLSSDETKIKSKKHVVIPTIPIPINIFAKAIQLDTLRVVVDRKKVIFKIDDMNVEEVSIIDNLLHAKSAKALPHIWDAPMNVSLGKITLNLDQPHDITATGRIRYSHNQLGDFISNNVLIGGTLTHYEVEGDIAWEERMLGVSNLSIKGVGDYHRATFTSAILEHAEGSLTAQGELAWIDKFSWDFNISGSDVFSRKLSPQWPIKADFNLDTLGEFGYSDKKWLMDINLNSLDGNVHGHPINATGGITLRDSILTANQFLLKTDKNKIFVEGRITEPFDLVWDINATHIGQLIPSYTGSIVGKGVVRGTTLEPTGSGTLKIKNFKGKFGGKQASIDFADIDLQGDSRENFLSGKGTATIRNARFRDFNVDSADIVFDGNEENSLLTGKGTATLKNLEFQDYKINSATIDLNGDEHGSFLSGTAKLIDIFHKDYKVASADITFTGNAGNEKASLLAGNATATLKNIEYKDYKADSADITFTGSEQASLFTGKGTANLSKLQYKDFSVAAVTIDFDGNEKNSLLTGKGRLLLDNLVSKSVNLTSATIDFDGSHQSIKLKGSLLKLTIAGKNIDRATLNTKGTLEHHRIKLQGESKEGDFIISASGGWLADKWKGTLNKVNIQNSAAGDWVLNKPVRVNVSKESFSGSEVCVTNPKLGQLCSEIKWTSSGGISTSGSLSGVPLVKLKQWLPPTIDLPGVVNVRYSIKQQDKKTRQTSANLYGEAEFLLPDSFIQITTKKGIAEKIAYRQGRVVVKFNGNKVDITTHINIAKHGIITSKSIVVLAPKTGQHRIQGEARFEVTELAWAQEFFPDITRLQGKVSSKVSFNGLLKKPNFSGELRLDKGRFAIPDAGTQLSGITLRIKTTRPNQATIKGSLNTGGGQLNIDGSLKINKLNDWLAELKLKGNNLRFMNTHEIQAYASPDLHLKLSPNLARVSGLFHIPKGRIKLSELPETAIYESDDVVFVGDQKNTDKEKPLRILPNVTISLGKDITFQGFGLNASLNGNFHVNHNRQSIVSRGTLKVINGVYRAYGQSLTIEHGVLVFNGPIANPGLDIRATRIIPVTDSFEDLKVGINLAGTLQKPKSSVFSDPPKSESDALSYLITGQSLSNTSGDQAQLLLQAVRSLGITSGSTMLNRIGGNIGLDDLNIITYSDYKKNKLQLGKRLGPNLYIRFITGLFDSFQKVAVDYKLGSKWSLQAESGENQGIDFIYNIDTN